MTAGGGDLHPCFHFGIQWSLTERLLKLLEAIQQSNVRLNLAQGGLDSGLGLNWGKKEKKAK